MTDDKTGAADTQTRAAETKPKAKTTLAPPTEDSSRSIDTDALVSEARAQERERFREALRRLWVKGEVELGESRRPTGDPSLLKGAFDVRLR